MATEVRTGLVLNMSEVEEKKFTTILDSKYFRKTIRQHVKEFACIFAIICLAYAGYAWYYLGLLSTVTYSVSGAFILLLLGYVFPIVLYPVWKIWMTLAHALGFVVTGVIISLIWVIAFLPLAFILRLVGKKVMDLSFDRSCKTYWIERDPKYHDFKLLERQF